MNLRNIFVIFQKETATFLNSLIAYMTWGIFLLGIGLFFWFFPNNVLESGEARMDLFFELSPWFFLFLIPAITMRMFAEEFKTGTIELLFTKPVRDIEIILGKYLAAVWLVVLAMLPTLAYYVSLYIIADPVGNVDTGAIIGSYLGLIGLGAIFAAIGVFASSLTDNQIIAFLIGILLCFFLFVGFDYLAELEVFVSFAHVVNTLGINEHYRSISRGVLDSRDLFYYLSVIVFFIWLTQLNLNKKIQ